jgi:hypothetical protein
LYITSSFWYNFVAIAIEAACKENNLSITSSQIHIDCGKRILVNLDTISTMTFQRIGRFAVPIEIIYYSVDGSSFKGVIAHATKQLVITAVEFAMFL